jgi:hypothetical protein
VVAEEQARRLYFAKKLISSIPSYKYKYGLIFAAGCLDTIVTFKYDLDSYIASAVFNDPQ